MGKYTWHFLLVALAGWMNWQQQDVIEYFKEENRILREKLGAEKPPRHHRYARHIIPLSLPPTSAAPPPPFLPPSTEAS